MKKLTNEQLQRVNTGVGIAAGSAGLLFTLLQGYIVVKQMREAKKAAKAQQLALEEKTEE